MGSLEIRRPVQTKEGRLLEAAIADDYTRDPHLSTIVKRREDDFIAHTIFVQEVWGVNHRGFYVGSVAVGVAEGRPVVLEGANHSPVKGIDKNCGEMGVLAQAQALGGAALEWLFVAGPSDEDTIATCVGGPTRTIRPCNNVCLPLLDESPYTTPDLQIVTIAAGPPRIVEVHTLETIIAEYASFEASAANLALADQR